jgi:transposase
VSLYVEEPGGIPAETAGVARAAFPKGALAIRIRDELGVMFRDEDFMALFPVRGRRALSPARLAMVLLLQHVEDLSDRQAALAVRSRIDWKYALVRHEAPLFRARVRGPCRWSVAAGW